MKLDFFIILNLDFTAENVKTLLKQFDESGYHFLAEKFHPIGELVRLSLEDAQSLVLNSHYLDKGQILSSELIAENKAINSSLSLYISRPEESEKIQIGRLYSYYDWDRAYPFLRALFVVLRPFSITKIKFGDDEAEISDPWKKDQAITVDWGWSFPPTRQDEQIQLLYNNIDKSGFFPLHWQSREKLDLQQFKTILLSQTPIYLKGKLVSFELTHDAYLYFAPHQPYLTRRFGDGKDINLAYYFLQVLNFCESADLLFQVETSGFDKKESGTQETP